MLGGGTRPEPGYPGVADNADRLGQGNRRDQVLEAGLDPSPDIRGSRKAPIGSKSGLGGTKCVSDNVDRLDQDYGRDQVLEAELEQSPDIRGW